MIDTRGEVRISALREAVLADYREKVKSLGYDETRHEQALGAIRSLGYERWMAYRWLASKAPRR